MKTQIIITALFVNAILIANTVFAADPPPSPPLWDYGDQNWGALEDNNQINNPPFMYPYALCSLGRRQSPIDLAEEVSRVKYFNKLQFKYNPDQVDFYNTGYQVQVREREDKLNGDKSDMGILWIGYDAYPLRQFHFHTPGEHKIGGKTFDAELHLVHIRDDGRAAVVGVFLEVGGFNQTIQTILDNMPHESGDDPNTGIKIDPRGLLPSHIRRIYTYAGSLTTPPCAEGISWYVLDEPITLSNDQLYQLQEFYRDNHRDLQDLKGREVTVSSPFVHFDTPFQIFR